MKKFLYLFCIVLASCGNETTPSSGNQAAAVTDTLPKEKDAAVNQQFPVAFYSATGAKGLAMQINMEMNGSYTISLTLPGKTEAITGSFQKSSPVVDGKVKVGTNETLFEGVFEGATEGKSATVRFKGDACQDNAGKGGTVCEIKVGKETFTACGNYAE